MFPRVSVCPRGKGGRESTFGGRGSVLGGRGSAWRGLCMDGRGYAWMGGGMHGWEGVCMEGGCLHGRGRPPPADRRPTGSRYAFNWNTFLFNCIFTPFL